MIKVSIFQIIFVTFTSTLLQNAIHVVCLYKEDTTSLSGSNLKKTEWSEILRKLSNKRDISPEKGNYPFSPVGRSKHDCKDPDYEFLNALLLEHQHDFRIEEEYRLDSEDNQLVSINSKSIS